MLDQPNKIEDIFSEVDTKTTAPRPGRPEQMVQYSPTAETSYAPSTKKKLWVGLGLLVLVLLLVGVIIVMIMRFDIFSKEEVIVVPVIDEVNEDLDIENEIITTQDSLEFPLDSDADGLTDEEETTLRTNVNKYDTDSDGLSDYEEVKLYNTDPTDSDSDDDGYIDGEELKAGYNPLGSGKLLNFEAALEKLKKQ